MKEHELIGCPSRKFYFRGKLYTESALTDDLAASLISQGCSALKKKERPETGNGKGK